MGALQACQAVGALLGSETIRPVLAVSLVFPLHLLLVKNLLLLLLHLHLHLHHSH